MAGDVRAVTVELVRAGEPEAVWVDVAYDGEDMVPGLVEGLRAAVRSGELAGGPGSRIVVIRHRPGPADAECACEGVKVGEGCELVGSHVVAR
jgi:hypothetical protein